MKKYFKLFTKHKQCVYFSIEPHPAYTEDPSNANSRWQLWRESFRNWEMVGEFHTMKDAHKAAEDMIENQNISEYQIETFGMAWA